MTTLTNLDVRDAEPISLHSHPIAKLRAAIHERCIARNLGSVHEIACFGEALNEYHKDSEHKSLPRAIDFGQRMADRIASAPRVHSWRGNSSELPTAS